MTGIEMTSRWGDRFAGWTLWGGVGAAILALVGSYGSGFGLWPFTIGFLFIGVALILAILALMFGLVAIIKKSAGRGVWLGLISALIFLGIMGYWIDRGRSNPPLHDISTDLANPPAFQKLVLRADNLIGVETVENWRAVHAKAFPDIQPVMLSVSPDEAIRQAATLVRARGWDVALVTADRIEATETASPFAFKDDVVITASPGEGGKGTVINIRSVSRLGLSDLGVNAARVRALMTDLKGT